MKKIKNNFMDTYKKIRKPMPPLEKIIPNEKDVKKNERFDWHKAIENDDDNGEDYRSIADDYNK